MTERLLGIKGPMFSEKTTTLMAQARRAEHAGKIVQIFKPVIDNRWATEASIKTHNKEEYPATVVSTALEMIEKLNEGVNFVGIDEAQFFDSQIVGVIRYFLERNIEVAFAGLPLNFKGEPFGSIHDLLALADKIINLTAVCKYKMPDGSQCNQDATKTQRIVNGRPANYNDPIVVIGAEEQYEARCPTHHFVPGRPERLLTING